ncbi:hypothetical protein [Phaeobacter piscinae]|uniref:hypothetical protein n=1 Tax=Phaeobacter piscinae TaxID=1580596 RepID=UPI000C9D208F|nr:hypothetical protein [Phaeobacter piscinae]AUQ74731.1 hypothetical protein PhaeoP71_01870 [Phaeobacter piscinae]
MRARAKKWLQDRLGITALVKENDRLNGLVKSQSRVIDKRLSELDELTKIDADVGFRGNCTVILTGVYRGRAYVQFYDLAPDHFRRYVEQLRWERKENLIRHVDAPAQFRGAFDLI